MLDVSHDRNDLRPANAVDHRLAGLAGRRVPVTALFDYIKAGETLEAFLDSYPSVSRAHAVAVIELANRAIAVPTAAE